MTAKEQLRVRIEGLSEDEARTALRVLEEHVSRDRLGELLANAPLDDEPADVDDDEDTRQAREQAARGKGIPLEQLRSELD